ncbi:MAG: sodium/solute symporter [Planctomycetes bacterium]|nr:sodium/solute symporter [Planctomycetota bacterium]
MTSLDFLVIALYVAGMLAVGRYYSTRTRTTDDYLLGGRNMSPLMIGLSLFATLTSTLSYLAYPGEMIQHGPMMFAQVTAYPLIILIVGWGLIPFIMRLRVTSAYELLESRLGLTGRLLGSGMFVALRTVWMASILYATSAKVLVPLLGLEPVWTPYLCAAMGLVTIVYTAEGGLRAVVVTDALQSLIMFGGAIVCVVVISVTLGGVEAWWPTQRPAHWQEPVFWPDPKVRVTFIGAFVNMLVWMVCTAGSDQMAIQRYLATRDVRAARRSFAIHLSAEALIAGLLALVGLAVLAYFRAHPESLGSGKSLVDAADELFPRFVVVGLPQGLTGLVMAAILSAAMSSLSSGMNSSSAVISTDFIGRFRQAPMSQREQVRTARAMAVLVGAVAILLSTVVGGLAGNLLELCVKVVNLLTAPLFVLFFLAMFIRWATPFGAIAATVASVAIGAGIAFGEWFGLTFLWTGPCSLVAGMVAGCVGSLVPMQGKIRNPKSEIRNRLE